jgi:hypothetical protein
LVQAVKAAAQIALRFRERDEIYILKIVRHVSGGIIQILREKAC